MSQETADALEAAMKAHYSDETGGGVLVDWTLGMFGMGMNSDKPAEYIFGNSASPIHSLKGLADFNLKFQEDRYYDESGEDVDD